MAVELVQLSLQGTRAVGELLEGVRKFIVALKGALADGWQPGKDLPVVLTSALADLVPVLNRIEKLGEEAKGNTVEFVNAVFVKASAIAKELLK